MNPRGTCAPIRFRVGRLQPGSATPPRNTISILHDSAASKLPVRRRQVLVLSKCHSVRCLHEALAGRVQMIGGEVGVALNHRQALPPAELLDRAQVYPSHDEPGGESVAVAMPRVRLQAFPSASSTRPTRSTAVGKNLSGSRYAHGEDGRVGIVRPRPLRCHVQQHSAHHAIHGHLAGAAVLRIPHREGQADLTEEPEGAASRGRLIPW